MRPPLSQGFARLAPEWTCLTQSCRSFASMSYEGSASQHGARGPRRLDRSPWIYAPAHSTTWALKGLVPRGSDAVILAEFSVLNALHAKSLPLPVHLGNPRYLPAQRRRRLLCEGDRSRGPCRVVAPSSVGPCALSRSGGARAPPQPLRGASLPGSGEAPAKDC